MDVESDRTCLEGHEPNPHFQSMSAELLLAENKKLKEHLEEAQRLAHIGSWDMDIIHGEVYWSDECYRIFGFEAQSFKPRIMQFLEYVHPKDREKVHEVVKNASAKGIPYKINFRIVRPDGSICHAFSKAQLDRDETGMLTRLYGTVQDITKRKLDEAEKARMRANLEEAQQIAHIGSWEWDIASDKLFWSDESYRLLELKPQSVPARPGMHYEYMTPEDKARVSDATEKALKERTPFDVEYCLNLPGGKKRYIRSQGHVRQDTSGQPISMTGTMQDITKRKLDEDKAKRYDEFERTVLHLAKDLINCPVDAMDSIIIESLEMISKYYNADRATVYRYDWEQRKAIQSHVWTSNPEHGVYDKQSSFSFDSIKDIFLCHEKGLPYRSIHIDDVDDASPYLSTAKQYKVQSVISIPLMSGGKASGAFTISSTKEKTLLSDLDISILIVLAEMLTNVLMRKERENVLQETNESNKLMLDFTSDGIAMYDREGLILNINENFAKRFGKSKQECIGKDFKDFLPSSRHQDLYNRRYKKLQKVFETGEPEADEDDRDGAVFFNRYHPVFKNGEVHAVTIFSTDITDRKRAEEEARAKAESEARLKVTTELFTNVSHEFKTPLSVILIQLELMKLYLDDAQKMHELIDAATQNSYRLNRLVGNLLDITKIDSGFMRVNMTHTDIVSTIREICESVGDYAKTRGIQLSFASETISKDMPVDMDKIERILLNLLSNAIKHTHAEGRIDVLFEDKGDTVSICVADTGEGIPIEKQASIFDRFAQVDTSLTRKNEGSGIGLALVHSFVRLLGGRIWVESEPGMGSTFFIELPVLQENQTALAIEMEGYSLKKKVEMELSDLYI